MLHRTMSIALIAATCWPPMPPAHPATQTAAAGVRSAAVAPVPNPLRVLTDFRPPAARWGAGHRGVDLAAPSGSPVRAALPGRVIFAGKLAGRGVVSVDHGRFRTTYEPVDSAVTVDADVRSGQRLGTLAPGHPSCAPASCLHWGARTGRDRYFDPMSLLGPTRVRLKPFAGG